MKRLDPANGPASVSRPMALLADHAVLTAWTVLSGVVVAAANALGLI